ncbi:MAG TPA: RagB/SusD family nutrient uptake outer membrane protein [Cyclobacteriaceae bacterium]|jgi:hypothetical protein|nr:RagB/SusD family nutrient uptake outer membrane protein [Cyclobacteriaceae bacterium]HRF35417.1 RagB/SusD family nutrient uptake outer membrane protein [Cyclobacteriaceae bacterium]
MKKLLPSVVLLVLVTSCEGVLDLDPKDVYVPEIAEKQLSTYQGLINATYNVLQSANYYQSNFLLTSDALADNVESVELRIFQAQTVNSVGAHFNIWEIYPGINYCNLVLDKVDNVIITDETLQRPVINRLKAEAYFLRALLYFDLHRAYAYEPNHIITEWDKGVILRTEAVTNIDQVDLRERATIEEGYALIESDLLKAIEIFDSNSINPGVYRANLGAAHALLARLYLYWEKWEDARNQVYEAYTYTNANIVEAANYQNSFAATPHPESLFELDFTPEDTSFPEKVTGSMRSLTYFSENISAHYFSCTVTDNLLAAFEGGDVRKNLITETLIGTNTYNMCTKWEGSKTGGLGYVDNVPMIRYAELLLIEAEASYRLNEEAEARSALNVLRQKRGLPDVTAALSGNALFDKIMNERRVEFYFEGHRWFDLKRNGLDITKDSGVNLSYTDFRILAPIPSSQTILNKKLLQNPGY